LLLRDEIYDNTEAQLHRKKFIKKQISSIKSCNFKPPTASGNKIRHELQQHIEFIHLDRFYGTDINGDDAD